MITEKQLHTRHRRLDRRIMKTAVVLKEMRAGAALHLEFRAGRSRWWLSNGREVYPDTACLVTQHRSIVGVGDALPFLDVAAGSSQTWRYAGA